jgi:hypothetical protein
MYVQRKGLWNGIGMCRRLESIECSMLMGFLCWSEAKTEADEAPLIL